MSGDIVRKDEHDDEKLPDNERTEKEEGKTASFQIDLSNSDQLTAFISTIRRSYSSPIPPASELAALKDVMEDGPDRVLKMAERQQYLSFLPYTVLIAFAIVADAWGPVPSRWFTGSLTASTGIAIAAWLGARRLGSRPRRTPDHI